MKKRLSAKEVLEKKNSKYEQYRDEKGNREQKEHRPSGAVALRKPCAEACEEC